MFVFVMSFICISGFIGLLFLLVKSTIYLADEFNIYVGLMPWIFVISVCFSILVNYGFDCGGDNDMCSYSEYNDRQ